MNEFSSCQRIQYQPIALIFKIFLLTPNLSMYRITCISLFGSLTSLYRDIDLF